MSDGDAIFAEVLAAPAEGAVRLAFADWLQERDGPGDAPRAEFIRVQFELRALAARLAHDSPRHSHGDAEGEYDPNCPRCRARDAVSALRSRERALLDRHRAEWFAAWPEAVVYVEPLDARSLSSSQMAFLVAGGFIAEVRCLVSDWFAHGDAIRAAHPVARVRLASVVSWRVTGRGTILLTAFRCEYRCARARERATGAGGATRTATRCNRSFRLSGPALRSRSIGIVERPAQSRGAGSAWTEPVT